MYQATIVISRDKSKTTTHPTKEDAEKYVIGELKKHPEYIHAGIRRAKEATK